MKQIERKVQCCNVASCFVVVIRATAFDEWVVVEIINGGGAIDGLSTT